MKNTLIKLIVCHFFITISACSSNKVLNKTYYRFAKTNQTYTQSSIIVKRPSALGIIGNRPMVAQASQGGLIQMQHSFWLDSPKILLFNYLENIFNHTTNSPELSFILNSQILHLEKNQDKAILSIKFILTDNSNALLLNKTYHYSKKLNTNTIPDFVISINELLKQSIDQLLTDIK